MPSARVGVGAAVAAVFQLQYDFVLEERTWAVGGEEVDGEEGLAVDVRG